MFNIYAEHPRYHPDGGVLLDEYVQRQDVEYLLKEYRLAYGAGWLIFAQECEDEDPIDGSD